MNAAVADSEPPNHTEIVRALLDAGAVRFGDFTLASGEKSDVYIDVKRAWTDPKRLDLLARALASRRSARPTSSPAWSWERSQLVVAPRSGRGTPTRSFVR